MATMNKKHRGTLSELKAMSWLLEKGFEVFVNVSPHGSIDLIAKKSEFKKTYHIDVTTGTIYEKLDGSLSISHAKSSNRIPGVSVIVVFDNDTFLWLHEDGIGVYDI